MNSEVELENSLRHDRLRRQRFAAAVVTAICALGAWFYYAVFANWPTPIQTLDGKVMSFRLTWWGWLRFAWIGFVIVVVGLRHSSEQSSSDASTDRALGVLLRD